MTVRCENCGTENRDKAMFCRGCAGKLPAFAPTGKPADDRTGNPRRAIRASGASSSPIAPGVSPSGTGRRRGFGLTGPRIVVFALSMALLGAAIAWFAMTLNGAERPSTTVAPMPADAERLPPEASLSVGEALADEGSASGIPVAPPVPPASSAIPAPASVEPNPVPDTPAADAEPTPSGRNSGRRPAPVAAGGSRASDPRTGCEHLFFAFAARCEANHCQLPAYARHPRCEVVREQRRRDDARRNSLPTS